MCGRFALFSNIEVIMKYADLIDSNIDWAPHYNISPSMVLPVIRNSEGTPVINNQKWGFVPDFVYKSNTSDKSFAPINVKSETVKDKPIFRNSFLKRRCLVPANGFYEWRKPDKQPFFISIKNHPLLFFAGIWNENKGKESQDYDTFAIITTRANDKLMPIHQRMPVIIHPDRIREWLMSDNQSSLLGLLKPYSDEDIEIVPVSREVNSGRIDHDGLIKAVHQAG